MLSIWQMIELAYAPEYNLISGSKQTLNQPAWAGEAYDIDARVSNADLKAWQAQTNQHELLRSALRAALVERCKLAIHEQFAISPTFELTIASQGSRLKPAAPVPANLVGVKLPSGAVSTFTHLTGNREVSHFHGATIADLVWFLSCLSPFVPVRDKTGLTGRYDFDLQEIDEPSHLDADRVFNYPVDRLGLKLKPGKENRSILVIDHIEKPTPN
jgi:uncharacterized protein (TIGR03435 family)